MPLYEYQCDACGHRFELIQKFSDPAPDACPSCAKAGAIRRLMSSPAIQFKGSGFYITDYAQKGKSGGESSGTGKASSAGGGDKAASSSSGEAPAKSDTAAKSDSGTGSSKA